MNTVINDNSPTGNTIDSPMLKTSNLPYSTFNVLDIKPITTRINHHKYNKCSHIIPLLFSCTGSYDMHGINSVFSY